MIRLLDHVAQQPLAWLSSCLFQRGSLIVFVGGNRMLMTDAVRGEPLPLKRFDSINQAFAQERWTTSS